MVGGMNKELFIELLDMLEEAGDVVRGERRQERGPVE
jgi:hypothetical protein